MKVTVDRKFCLRIMEMTKIESHKETDGYNGNNAKRRDIDGSDDETLTYMAMMAMMMKH